MTTAYLGIDPGLSGAIALYWPKDGQLEVYDVPTYTITRNRGKRRVIDTAKLATLANTLATLNVITFGVIEDVNAMPGQGVASAFTFGLVTGQIGMAFVAQKVPLTSVPAFRWKRYFGLNRDKDAARRLASSLLPRHAHNWPLVGHDGRAEAALLALYAVKTQP